MSAHNAPNTASEFKGWVVPGVLASGTTVPADGQPGFETGCLFIHTDGDSSSTYWYINEGSITSCNFDAITLTIA